jgi:hypothetical protein
MSHAESPHTPPADTQSLAASLGPALRDATQGRLGEIEWFRSTWQRGGAATGFAEWQFRDGHVAQAMVKLPIAPNEYRWTTVLGAVEPEEWDAQEARSLPTPRVLATGESLAGYDLAWLVIERFPGHPIAGHLSEPLVRGMLGAAADMHARAARSTPLPAASEAPDWAVTIDKARAAVRDGRVLEEQRWANALRSVSRSLDALTRHWRERPVNTWCHGDVHPGNAMERPPNRAGAPGRCVLIDLALVHPGHWVEDAVYVERVHWARPEVLCGVRPVEALAKLRRERGLADGGEYVFLADIRRVLAAASVPAFLAREGHPAYVRAALDILERTLPVLT